MSSPNESPSIIPALSEFAPEHQQILRVAYAHLSEIPQNLRVDVPSSIDIQNQAVLVQGKLHIRRVPSGNTWSWNQAKRKLRAVFPLLGIQVQFCKLTPRVKREKVRERPGHLSPFDTQDEAPFQGSKVWLVHATVREQDEYSLIWCERGRPGLATFPRDRMASPPFAQPTPTLRPDPFTFETPVLPSISQLERGLEWSQRPPEQPRLPPIRTLMSFSDFASSPSREFPDSTSHQDRPSLPQPRYSFDRPPHAEN